MASWSTLETKVWMKRRQTRGRGSEHQHTDPSKKTELVLEKPNHVRKRGNLVACMLKIKSFLKYVSSSKLNIITPP
jgi:hypothetical protein